MAEALYPKNAQLHSDLGDLYAQVGNKDRAIAYYKKALKIAPKFKAARDKLNKLQKR